MALWICVGSSYWCIRDVMHNYRLQLNFKSTVNQLNISISWKSTYYFVIVKSFLFNQCLFTSKQSACNNTCAFCGLWCRRLMLNQCFWWRRQKCEFSVISRSAAVFISLCVEENATVNKRYGLHEWTIKLKEKGGPSQQWHVLVFRHDMAKDRWHHLNIHDRMLLRILKVVSHIVTHYCLFYNDIN